MPAGGGNLQPAFNMLLALDLRKVRSVVHQFVLKWIFPLERAERHLSRQVVDEVREGADRIDVNPFDQGSLGGIGMGHKDPL